MRYARIQSISAKVGRLPACPASAIARAVDGHRKQRRQLRWPEQAERMSYLASRRIALARHLLNFASRSSRAGGISPELSAQLSV